MNNLIEIKGLCKQYPTFALKDVSFNVPGGAIVGFVGENGAGKTTTIKAILDIVRKDAGSITLLEQDSTHVAPALREDVGVVFDEICYHNWLRPKQIANIATKAGTTPTTKAWCKSWALPRPWPRTALLRTFPAA